jgi:hypothetical protein
MSFNRSRYGMAPWPCNRLVSSSTARLDTFDIRHIVGRSIAALALVFLSGGAFAASGYAHGADHCYYFDAPRGWTMDNAAGARDGVPMVFYPAGTTWQTAPVAMYTRPASSSNISPEPARIAEQVERVVQMYRSNSENIEARRVQDVRARSGSTGELWQYTGYSNGGAELVVYYPAPRTINFFVLQLPQAETADEYRPILVELAESYRAASDCRPCSSSGACTAAN